MVLVGRELCDAGADLLLPFFAVFREFGKDESGGVARILEPLLDGEAVRLLALPNQSVVGRQNVSPKVVRRMAACSLKGQTNVCGMGVLRRKSV